MFVYYSYIMYVCCIIGILCLYIFIYYVCIVIYCICFAFTTYEVFMIVCSPIDEYNILFSLISAIAFLAENKPLSFSLSLIL